MYDFNMLMDDYGKANKIIHEMVQKACVKLSLTALNETEEEKGKWEEVYKTLNDVSERFFFIWYMACMFEDGKTLCEYKESLEDD